MKFSLREQLLVTMVVGLAIGWFLDHRAQMTVQGNHQLSFKQAVRQMKMYEGILQQIGCRINPGERGEVSTVTMPPYFTGQSIPSSPFPNSQSNPPGP